MNLNLSNKYALVTGSSSGLGLGIAQTLHKEGCNVILNGRSETRLKKTVSKFTERARYLCGDVTSFEECARMAQTIKSEFKSIDILVCNVGSGGSVAPGCESPEEWRRVFDLNFFSTTNIVQALRPIMKMNGGTIVCVSSICGLEHISGSPIPYSVAKSALNSFVVNQSKFFGNFKIRINAIAPGNIIFQGSTWSKKMKNLPSKTKNYINQNVPLKLFGKPDDVSNMVLYLSSDKTKYITGSIFKIDGGQVRSW